MSKDSKPARNTPNIPPKGSLVRDLADWKSGDRSNPPQSIKDYVERTRSIPLPNLPDSMKDGD